MLLFCLKFWFLLKLIGNYDFHYPFIMKRSNGNILIIGHIKIMKIKKLIN
jgi:hypothetical protein